MAASSVDGGLLLAGTSTAWIIKGGVELVVIRADGMVVTLPIEAER